MRNKKLEVLKAADMIIRAANTLGLVDSTFKLRVKIHSRPTLSGGLNRRGEPELSLSTHERYLDPIAYAESVKLSFPSEAVWKNAQHQYKITGVPRTIEYASFDSDPEIGGINTTNSNLILLMVGCHEIAHAINFWIAHKKPVYIKPKPHGKDWKEIYRQLRNALVNPYLENTEVQLAAFVKSPLPRPKSGTITGELWDFFDTCPGLSRKGAIYKAVNNGYKVGTASTQYSKWRKENT